MAPNKDWMNLNHGYEYEAGVKSFLDYAFRKLQATEIRCPCVKCLNVYPGCRDDVEAHLLCYGIIKRYTLWYHHGETLAEPESDYNEEDDEFSYDDHKEVVDEMGDVLRDLYPEYGQDPTIMENQQCGPGPIDEANAFYKLLEDSQCHVYEGCKISMMSAMVKLLHFKTLGGWSNESFTWLLKFLKEDLLPMDSKLPDSYYEANKIMKNRWLSYEKIDACFNDCMLFWKENESLDACRLCGTSRWKIDKRNGDSRYKSNGRKIPEKTLSYFPLRPRLQRLYMCSKTASLMRWHHDERNKDAGILTHPADGLSWASFDDTYKDIALEPRNVRLGFSSDGFEPFKNAKKPHSIWPVVLVPYNLPPELCMRQSNLILSMLIPGPQGPGNAIDVYLQPLVEELKELWKNGVKTYDASTKCYFQMRAALLWTINDFPAYGMLSGWSTKGKLACPVCLKGTHSMRLDEGGKECYLGHRRYLCSTHRWRKQGNLFDGEPEHRPPPKDYLVEELIQQMQDLEGKISGLKSHDCLERVKYRV